MDIVLIEVPKKVQKLSRRRQKKAIAKLPKRVLKNCYPQSVGEPALDNGLINVVVNFSYDVSLVSHLG